jgi:DNA-binding MarR family transcriptional regulator
MSKDMQVVSLNSLGEVPVALVSPVAAEAGCTEPGALPADAVDQMPELDAVESRAWRSFLIAHARVARRLEADLVARSHLPLAEFDVLMQLSLAEGQRLRMNELADRVVLSRAGITRLVDRLVAVGSVARTKCASDARGAYATLTDPGRARLDQARPGHFEAVRRYFIQSFTKPELEALADLLDRDFPVD